MSLQGWKSRAGLCVMRPQAGRSPCLHCLGERLREAGFAPRGPLQLEGEPELEAAIAIADCDRHRLHASVLRIDRGSVTCHPLLALPGCPRCAGSQTANAADEPDREPLPADCLLDPLLGIGSWLRPVSADPSGNEAALCDALTGQVHTPGDRHAIAARGQGHRAAQARLGHLGETVERYAAFRPDKARIVTARAGELPDPALLGAELFGLAPAQRAAARYVALDGRRRIGWIAAQRLADGATRWVPAASVFLSREWQLDEARFCASVSHGLAAHRSADAAIGHGLFELHERVCMTRAWHRQDFGLRLDPRGLDAAAASLARRVAAAGLRLHLMALTWPPAVPAVMALLWSDHVPRFMIGAGADFGLQQAASSALLEACCGWQSLVERPEREPRRFRLRATEDARAHHRYYASAERARIVVEALLRGTRPAPRRWPGGATAGGVDALARQLSPQACVVDLTPPDCAACGFSVQRVLAPGAPLYAFGRIGTPRHFQRAAGWPDPPLPHPFR